MLSYVVDAAQAATGCLPLVVVSPATEAVRGEAEAVLAEGGHPSVPGLLRSALRHLDRA